MLLPRIKTSLIVSLLFLCAFTGAAYADIGCRIGNLIKDEGKETFTFTCISTFIDDCGDISCNTALTIPIKTVNGTVVEYQFICAGEGEACSGCFSKDTNVHRIVDRKPFLTSISSIKDGDLVLDGDGEPAEVFGFIHREEDTQLKMLDFLDTNGNKILTVSHKHLLFKNAKETQFAEDFNIGDELYLAQTNDYLTIAEIETKDVQALYSPLTKSGTLMVGEQGIKASCYSNMNHHSWANFFYQWQYSLGLSNIGKSNQPTKLDWTLLWLAQKLGLAG